MDNKREWFVRTEDGNVYGPADESTLVAWAKDGRIEPTSFVSKDRISWMPAQLMDALGMEWLVESEPGKVFGPFNREVVIGIFRDGSLPPTAKAYRLYAYPVDQDPPPVEKIVEKEVIKEVRVEVPVEKIVEKIVEVAPSARTELVVPEVVEPSAAMPPARSPGALFANVGRDRLAALEAAAKRELASAGGMKFGRFFGRR